MSHSNYCIATAATTPGSVYVLAFENHSWADPLEEMDGLEYYECNAESGVLGVFQTRELAIRVGEAWARLQFKIRVWDYCETEEEREEALEGWDIGGVGYSNGPWRYYMECYSDSLIVKVNEMEVMTEFDGLEDEEDGEDGEDGEDEEDEEDEEEGDDGDGKNEGEEDEAQEESEGDGGDNGGNGADGEGKEKGEGDDKRNSGDA